MMQKLLDIFQKCERSDINEALTALDDLGYLLERHRVIREDYSQYSLIFNDKSLVKLKLSTNDIKQCEYFLFYMLMNYPDRAWRVAWCLFKCYDETITTGLHQAIKLYMQSDDVATFNLVLAITNTTSLENLDSQTIDLFKELLELDLPTTNEYMSRYLE